MNWRIYIILCTIEFIIQLQIIYLVVLVAAVKCDEYGLPPKNHNIINFLPGVRQPIRPGFQSPIVVAEFPESEQGVIFSEGQTYSKAHNNL